MTVEDQHVIAQLQALRARGVAITAGELDYQLHRHGRPGAGQARSTLERLQAAGIVHTVEAAGGGPAWTLTGGPR